jgi:hypothetical protein
MSKDQIRQQEIEVFTAFIRRALGIVNGQHTKDSKDSLADACRLVDTALKAERRDDSGAEIEVTPNDGLKEMLERIVKVYGEGTKTS